MRPHASTQIVNLTTNPDYLKLRQRLVLALRQHPEAMSAVVEVFRGMESEAAQELRDAMVKPAAAPTHQIECTAVEHAA
ncbi:hypothetical protein ACRAWG_15815 [Methylobacterium sp. P31]